MSFKLVYFDIRGRGELSRLLLAAAGQKYEDKRIKFEEWATVKPTTPLGTLPLLEIEGEVIPQSLTIVRYLARTFKLMGKNDLEEAKINVVIDTVNDFKNDLYTAHFEKDEAKKEWLITINFIHNVVANYYRRFPTDFLMTIANEKISFEADLMKKLMEETLPKILTYLEEMVKKNKSGFIVGQSVSAADLILYDGLEATLKNKPDLLDKYPGIKSVREKVAKLPRIATYLKERPESDM